MVFQCFYVRAIRCCFGKVANNSTTMSQHEALKGAHVHEMTLCVTFGAPHFRTHFRFFTVCPKSTVIHMLLGTHVPQTALCVTFGARLRSVPLGLLDSLLAARAAKAAQGLRNGSGWVPFGPPTSPRDALRTLLRHARNCSQTSRRVSSVGGSAMHMKWPDGIGREAGIGRTRSGDELKIFRACP